MNTDIVDILFKAYQEDPEFKTMYEKPTTPFSKESQLLYVKGRLCVPKCRMRNDLLPDNHTAPVSDPLGARKTYLRIQPYYYWKGLRDTVDRDVAGCKTFQATKAQNHKPFGLL